jgi:hypothetical protein
VKIPLTTPEAIEQAVRSGESVFWRDSPVVETRAHKFLVNVPANDEHYRSWKLTTVIQTCGVIDFYYHTTNLTERNLWNNQIPNHTQLHNAKSNPLTNPLSCIPRYIKCTTLVKG